MLPGAHLFAAGPVCPGLSEPCSASAVRAYLLPLEARVPSAEFVLSPGWAGCDFYLTEAGGFGICSVTRRDMNHKTVQAYRIPIVDMLNGLVQRVGAVAAWANLLLVGVILVQVVLRYGFNMGLVPLEELMWHLYSFAFMIGMSYAVTNDSHIRVDIVHMRLSWKAQAWWEIIGILVLLMPFLVIVIGQSIEWVAYSYEVGEASQNPTGLPYRWIIKSVVPISFILLFIAALARLIRKVLILMHLAKEPEERYPGRVSMLRHLFHVHEPEKQSGEANNPDSAER